ncbi:unnamed protein product [Dimorphilus gyrociliatus]|uniref:Death domain-containing protein n=1 Tax=Dimorphilus gyrociliatus TaxID=2664684 RepID=A0A7I8VXB0_9ANNE|nr:unnamed protein product [Dimorphilus gyrociliatus]
MSSSSLDSPNTSRRRRAEYIPVSLEVVRARIMRAIYNVEKECHIFSERYLSGPPPDTEKWLDSMEKIASNSGKKLSELEDYKDFEPLQSKSRVETKEYGQLRTMCERGRVYEYISFSLKNDLYDAYTHQLKPYCLSFYQEAEGYDLKPIDEQERKISQWDSDIRERFQELDSTLDEMDTYGAPGPITKYINNYDRVYDLMKEIVERLRRVCEPMKRWVTSDATYTRKIQQEINMYNKKKLELRDVLKALEAERDRLELKSKRKSLQASKVERFLTEARDEKRYFKRRELDAREHRNNVARDRDNKWRDLEKCRHKMQTRKENSPTVFNYLSSTTENLKDEIRRLDGKGEVIDTQITTLQAEQDRIDRDILRLRSELDTAFKSQEIAAGQLERQNQDMELVLADIQLHSNRVTILKRIRELKLHSDTVKKIYHYGYTPGMLTHEKDELEEAFKLASEDVGKDWVWLYHKLPFAPPRDYRSRSQDLEVIDLSNRRLDGGFKILTVKCLEKWRRLSMNASVPLLVSTLKKIKKREAARKIERQLTKSPSVTNEHHVVVT